MSPINNKLSQLLPFGNKVVWITGASSGIGEQLCHHFAQGGASLILSARNKDKLEQVASQLPIPTDRILVLPLDLEQLEQLPDKAEEAIAHFGYIDCLVNNAGIGLRDYALATQLATDQKIMAVNYFGAIVLTKAVLPQMLKRGSGQLVVMSSLSGKFGVPRTSAYTASKHALHGFFESLRSEIVGSGVFITILVPGLIQTDITAHALVGDGSFFGRVEKTFQKAYPADKAAAKMIQAILKKKEEVFIGGFERITLFLNRISPWFLRRFIRNHPVKKFRALKRRLLLGKN